MVPGHATPEGTRAFAASSGANPANYADFDGLRLSNVGMGTYLGEPTAETDAAVTAAVKQSVRLGVNVIDTAINYRSQKAERAVGRAVAGLADSGVPREGLFISTKNGYVTDDADAGLGFWEYVKKEYTDRGVVKEGDISSGYHCMTVPYLEDQLGRSLENLGLETIDLMYIHNAVEGQHKDAPREGILAGLREAFAFYEGERKRGRIRYYGMATWDCLRVPRDDPRHLGMEEAVSLAKEAGGGSHGLRFVQLPFNMYYDQALLARTQTVGGREVSALDAAAELGLGAFASVPFMQGRLLRPGVMPEFGDLPPPARALQFVRSAPGIIAPLAGHKAPAHVDENLAVMGTPPIPGGEFGELVKRLTS